MHGDLHLNASVDMANCFTLNWEFPPITVIEKGEVSGEKDFDVPK